MHVIATAGHVDHGKSTLIRALTGMEPDRWAEERRRGMTIDLGYAWTTLDDGSTVAFVDVPGHQRFITNMLAGIGPVPAVLLVVAADSGWSRQTTEHLAALDALDVRHGVLAITRSDLGDADLAIEEARDYLHGTSLEHIEAVAVSPVAGTGLEELRSALVRAVAELPPPDPRPTRLWVDRVFTIAGAGTVVTGTLGTGTIGVGDKLTVSSTGQAVHVRALENLKIATTSVSAVARVAVNLRGVKKSDLRRGDALVDAPLWAHVREVDVRLVRAQANLPGQPILHIGSAAVAVRLRPLGPDFARLSFATSLPLHVGDRAVLRDPGPEQIVAGVIVLDPNPPALTRRGAAAQRAAELAEMTGHPDAAGEISRRRAVRRDQLVAAGVMTPDHDAPMNAVVAGDWLIDSAHLQHWQTELPIVVDAWAALHPLMPGMPVAAAVQRLALPDPAILELIARADPELALDADGVHRRGVTATLDPLIESALGDLERRLGGDPFGAPEAPELVAAGLTERHLATATKAGRLVRLAPGIYLRPSAIDEALRRLAVLPQPFTMSEARQALGTSRRVALPLLEFLDRRRSTIRIDSDHRAIRT